MFAIEERVDLLGRLPQKILVLHCLINTTNAGLIIPLIAEALRGRACLPCEGQMRWSPAHPSDVAKLYVLALERGKPGARYHASVEEGVTARTIAEAIGKGTGLPVRSIGADDVERYFGWMAPFAGLDMIASNAWTRTRLGWQPTGPDLLTHLAAMDYSALIDA